MQIPNRMTETEIHDYRGKIKRTTTLAGFVWLCSFSISNWSRRKKKTPVCLHGNVRVFNVKYMALQNTTFKLFFNVSVVLYHIENTLNREF